MVGEESHLLQLAAAYNTKPNGRKPLNYNTNNKWWEKKAEAQIVGEESHWTTVSSWSIQHQQQMVGEESHWTKVSSWSIQHQHQITELELAAEANGGRRKPLN